MKKVHVIATPKVVFSGPDKNGVNVTGAVTTQTSWGSVAATAGGIAGSVTPFLPPPYQWVGGMLAALFGVIATKLP